MKNEFSTMPNSQTDYHFKLDFQQVDQHTGGKWLIINHGNKHGQAFQLQSLKPLEYHCRECKHDIKESYCDFYTHEQWAGINHIQVIGAYVGA